MQNDNILKREFKEKDVNRIRNIITKKYGKATVTQVGYSKAEVEHKEGDVWTENNKEWTIKNGLKQSFTKLDAIKKAVILPLLCPECNNPMKHNLDKKMFNIHGKCFDCVVVMETELKRQGKYQDYVNEMVLKNMRSYIDDARQFVNDFVNESGDIYYTEEGEKEAFIGDSNKKKLLDTWNIELEEMEQTLKNKIDELS